MTSPSVCLQSGPWLTEPRRPGRPAAGDGGKQGSSLVIAGSSSQSGPRSVLQPLLQSVFRAGDWTGGWRSRTGTRGQHAHHGRAGGRELTEVDIESVNSDVETSNVDLVTLTILTIIALQIQGKFSILAPTTMLL